MPEFFYPFKSFSILKFAMTKWFFRGTCFFNVLLSLFLSLEQFYAIFIMKKVFYTAHTSHQVIYQHFFIIEIIVESVNLIQIPK